MARTWEGAAGRLMLALAALLHRTVTGKAARKRPHDCRDAALRAAYRRGVPLEVLASRTRLTQGRGRGGGTGGEGPPGDEAA
ncbi:hypothetical protein B5181_14380 [Streptomyces sp. 4F]|nr:hypothetical protein B5181_14380 [Streptomyces sp. 4F]